jgi:fucose 4-O-acetylase-like acetyltransferase
MTTNVGAQVREMTQIKDTVATKVAVASSRMAFMDNLRVFLTILVILLHMAITYGADFSWFYAERPTTELASILLTLFVGICQFFFMGLFFLISGYFTPASIDRKGTWQYIKDRLVRLGIPLVLFSLLVSPFTEYVKDATVYKTDPGNFVGYAVEFWKGGDYAPGPLWFVEVLLVFSLVYALGRAILAKKNAAKASPTAIKKPLTNAWILAFILIVAPLNFIVRIFSPIGEEWQHIQLAFMPQYILMFPAGILAYRRGWLPDLPSGLRKFWSVVAVLAMLALPVIMVLSGITDGDNSLLGGLNWQSAVLSVWEPIYCIAMSIMLLNLFQHRFNRQGALGRVMSKNAYSVYIIHPLVIIPGAYLLRTVSLDPLLKWALISPMLVAICFMVSHWLVRRIPMTEKIL